MSVLSSSPFLANSAGTRRGAAVACGNDGPPWSGSIAVLATMHGKERAIAPFVTRFLGLEIRIPDGLETDVFGTFSREAPRLGTPPQAARARVAEARFGLASPIPTWPFCRRAMRSWFWSIAGLASSWSDNPRTFARDMPRPWWRQSQMPVSSRIKWLSTPRADRDGLGLRRTRARARLGQGRRRPARARSGDPPSGRFQRSGFRRNGHAGRS